MVSASTTLLQVLQERLALLEQLVRQQVLAFLQCRCHRLVACLALVQVLQLALVLEPALGQLALGQLVVQLVLLDLVLHLGLLVGLLMGPY